MLLEMFQRLAELKQDDEDEINRTHAEDERASAAANDAEAQEFDLRWPEDPDLPGF